MSSIFLIVKGEALFAEAEAARRGFEIVAPSRDFGYGRTRVEVAEVDSRTGINVGGSCARWLCEAPSRAPYPAGTLLYYDTVREQRTAEQAIPEFVVDVVD